MFTRMSRRLIVALSLLIVFTLSTVALASDKIRIASVSWTGVTIKTDLAVTILDQLGYNAENLLVSVPVAYQAMSTGDADAFLGNWMPSMKTLADKYFQDGSVVQLCPNMTGAKYTLAVPTYEYEAGLKNFSDIAKFADKLDHKIYGIEEGNDGNIIIENMIKKNMFNLGNFKLVASSEIGMLGEVHSFVKDKKWIVFLGWAPHSMNENIDMKYLDGSTDETFGPDNGSATVYTNVRKGFTKDYPNLTVFLKNFTFPVAMMNQIMVELKKDQNQKPVSAALHWLKSHPDMYKGWLKDVKTKDGKPALPAFEAYMKTVE
ncbi:ABC transporter substrate-binding protein [Desulfovibrio inopinatus]|uniref:ABC transporter substrate-binding protein n=1 Tax=Desulfovibrio inopinatus TaxID=102109 RepID=UPI0003FBE53D|nr:ABC transporter substrate-binding protein [Desulfovibrio inopinatus]